MRHVAILVFLILLVCLTGCKEPTRTPLKIDMYNTAGDTIGTANLVEQPDGVKIQLKIEGLEPGFHGIHVHEYPVCEGPDFKSAGSHFNPDNKEHGLMYTEGPHLGDLPNIEVPPDGLVDTELTVNGATLLDGKNSLLRNEGTSLVIHASQDDGVSQPAGNSGDRVACGQIQLEKEGESPSDPTETNKPDMMK
ncbi:superoxide dismutase family protein [Radiobacillus deserti]|nr:superoxide dismutase family protein [Radiobacillus deserti]